MHFNPIEVAAWFIIMAGGKWILESLANEGVERRENLAARMEYKNVKTSEQRKKELLARYANSIVDAPNREFRMAAREQLEQEKLPWSTRTLIWTFSAIAFGILLLVIEFGEFLFHLVFR